MKTKSLSELYLNTSKHSDYQEIHPIVKDLLEIDGPTVIRRHESARMEFFKSSTSFKEKEILDIGGNTGYFTFDALSQGAKNVDFFEGNSEHAEFVKEVGRELGLNQKLNVFGQYYEFDKADGKIYDVAFLLNVLHHLGDDYGDQLLTISNAKGLILDQLNYMAAKARVVIFQLGYNWKGNPDLCLFSHGTKAEQIEFLQNGVTDFWEIERVGIATISGNTVQYSDSNPTNLERDDSYGEFLNRPIFLLKSKVIK